MKKSLLALSLLSPITAASPAFCLPTAPTYNVYVEGSHVGSIKPRTRVVDEGSSCRYTLQWSNLDHTRTVRCDIRESKASNAFDCSQNSKQWVTTMINRAGSCRGFDEFGQETSVPILTGGEFEFGGISGNFYAASVGEIQSLEIY